MNHPSQDLRNAVVHNELTSVVLFIMISLLIKFIRDEGNKNTDHSLLVVDEHGIRLLHAIQDVYLCSEVTIA